ncbi:uncharacterized protein LOC116917043 [Daphnia magna]|uniref:uncharacterized protein LOC116917043 n=1 Tax=Daphnia magna TaxID=35525 RepID=UPI001E1BCFCF|nr:uncharacterized protein LOC116917043 [Daphnia magna]
MKRTSLKIVFEIQINSVICPNTRLDPSKWVHLRVGLLGWYLRSRLLKAQFPLQVDEKMRVERTFPLCSASRHLYSALIGERLCVELVQLYQMGPKILASFNTDVNDIVFESPEIIRGKQIRTEQHTMIMHTTHHFPGIANPYVNATITVRLVRINDCSLEISRDGGYNLTLGLKASENPHYEAPLHESSFATHWSEMAYPLRPCQRMAISRPEPSRLNKPVKRQIFCVRRVDNGLIGRTPSVQPPFHNVDRVTATSNYVATRRAPSPMQRSNSHMDTVSSLLRRKPKINQGINEYEPEYEKKYGWGLQDQSQPSDTTSPSTFDRLSCEGRRRMGWEVEDTDFSHQQDFSESHPSQKRDANNYYINHNSEICTLCTLYYEYFGRHYPMHIT